MFASMTLQDGRLPPKTALPSFADIQSAVGFPEYYAEAARYTMQSAPDELTPSASAASQEQLSRAEEDAAPPGTRSGKCAAADTEVAISFEDDQATTNKSADRRCAGINSAFVSCTWFLHNLSCSAFSSA